MAEIRCLFTATEIREYLDHLERKKYLAPSDPDLGTENLNDDIEDEPWVGPPVIRAEELLRFARLRHLLQP